MCRLREGQAFGRVGGVAGVMAAKPKHTVNVRVKIDGQWEIRQETRGGFPLDVMLQNLQADGRWPWLDDIEDLTKFLDKIQLRGIPKRGVLAVSGHVSPFRSPESPSHLLVAFQASPNVFGASQGPHALGVAAGSRSAHSSASNLSCPGASDFEPNRKAERAAGNDATQGAARQRAQGSAVSRVSKFVRSAFAIAASFKTLGLRTPRSTPDM